MMHIRPCCTHSMLQRPERGGAASLGISFGKQYDCDERAMRMGDASACNKVRDRLRRSSSSRLRGMSYAASNKSLTLLHRGARREEGEEQEDEEGAAAARVAPARKYARAFYHPSACN